MSAIMSLVNVKVVKRFLDQNELNKTTYKTARLLPTFEYIKSCSNSYIAKKETWPYFEKKISLTGLITSGHCKSGYSELSKI